METAPEPGRGAPTQGNVASDKKVKAVGSVPPRVRVAGRDGPVGRGPAERVPEGGRHERYKVTGPAAPGEGVAKLRTWLAAAPLASMTPKAHERLSAAATTRYVAPWVGAHMACCKSRVTSVAALGSGDS